MSAGPAAPPTGAAPPPPGAAPGADGPAGPGPFEPAPDRPITQQEQRSIERSRLFRVRAGSASQVLAYVTVIVPFIAGAIASGELMLLGAPLGLAVGAAVAPSVLEYTKHGWLPFMAPFLAVIVVVVLGSVLGAWAFILAGMLLGLDWPIAHRLWAIVALSAPVMMVVSFADGGDVLVAVLIWMIGALATFVSIRTDTVMQSRHAVALVPGAPRWQPLASGWRLVGWATFGGLAAVLVVPIVASMVPGLDFDLGDTSLGGLGSVDILPAWPNGWWRPSWPGTVSGEPWGPGSLSPFSWLDAVLPDPPRGGFLGWLGGGGSDSSLSFPDVQIDPARWSADPRTVAVVTAVLVGIPLVLILGAQAGRAAEARRAREAARSWASHMLTRLERAGRRRHRPRQPSEGVADYCRALAAEIEDDRLTTMGVILNAALYSDHDAPTTDEEWVRSVADELFPPTDVVRTLGTRRRRP